MDSCFKLDCSQSMQAYCYGVLVFKLYNVFLLISLKRSQFLIDFCSHFIFMFKGLHFYLFI